MTNTSDFVIASENQHKINEIKKILEPLNINIKTCKEVGVDLKNIEESGITYEENAKIKAEYVFNKTGLSVIADDSGLSVNALDGRPGVFSARYAGEHSSYEEKINKLLDELKYKSDRTAQFKTCIYCILADGERLVANGECQGKIAYISRGHNGFGYDPIFLLGNGKTFAELSDQEKNSISHRGRALQNFKNLLCERLKGEFPSE